MEKNKDRTWAEINLANLVHNARAIKNQLRQNVKAVWVVKADAYGHGAVKVCQKLEEFGTDYFAVATIDEALYLRQNNITSPILVLSSIACGRVKEVASNDITVAVFSHEDCQKLSEEACEEGVTLKIHIAVDTGMGRVGLNATDEESSDKAYEDVMDIIRMPGLFAEGIFTHFATADEKNEEYTLRQFDFFHKLVNKIRQNDLPEGIISIAHCANSATIIRFPQMQMDMVRAGIILYGMNPSEYIKTLGFDLKPVMAVKSRVSFVKKIEEDLPVSYGSTFVAPKGSYVVTVPIGYADGYRRNMSNKAQMEINGNALDVIGRVCMDQTMLDATEMFNRGEVIKRGDIVDVFGGTLFTADDIAKICGTINYEITSGISQRVARIYIE